MRNPNRVSMRRGLTFAGTVLLCYSSSPSADSAEPAFVAQIGREVSIPKHLADEDEFRMLASDLVAYGATLFSANWTVEEGGGRPLAKGTGRTLSDPEQPLRGNRGFNRISGPDANSCAGCHNVPNGIAGGGGDFVTNVFVLGQRFDFVTFDPKDTLPTRGTVDEKQQQANLQDAGNSRATTGLFGAGYLVFDYRVFTGQMLAKHVA